MRHLSHAVAFVLLTLTVTFAAAPPAALPEGERPDDRRLGDLRTLNDYFPFTPVDSAGAWEQRAEDLRRRVLVSNGLWPMPTKIPLDPVIHGKVERDGYTVEKVYFQSAPGHFVTGGLYRPEDAAGDGAGDRPAVLCPHGHWPNGRFHDHGAEEVRRQIAAGAERFERGGRHPIQARAVQLARMGCVVFVYDMLGYADSVQFEHRPGVRERMNTPESWGFFSPQAELRLQNMMGLQTFNSIRALDFVLSLDDVDPDRVAVTGASGGGTQTMMLTAADDRIDAAFPAVMVSTAMQGGCTCENAPLLRIDAGNIDFAALTAPRPLGLTAADDWTRELRTKGYPDLQNLYQMLGHPDRLTAAFHTHFPHNYNHVNRTVMYNFINEHFGLGLEEPVLERDYEPLTEDEASVWNEQHPPPTGERVGDSHERDLLRMWTEDSQEQLDALVPSDRESLDEYRRVVGGAWDVMLGRSIEGVGEVDFQLTEKIDRGDHLLMTGLITHTAEHEQLPALFLHPDDWNGEAVLWITNAGKAGLFGEDGSPIPHVARLLDAGFSIAGVDLLGQGEFTGDGDAIDHARLGQYGDGEQPWQRYAGYTFGYNHSLFAKRVHDILTTLQFIRTDSRDAERIHLVGLGPVAGPLAAAARAQAGDTIDKTAIDTAGFRFHSLTRFDHPMFLPGAAKYHDLPGLLALCAPHPLWLAGENEAMSSVTGAAYRASDRENLHLGEGEADMIDWLLGPR